MGPARCHAILQDVLKQDVVVSLRNKFCLCRAHVYAMMREQGHVKRGNKADVKFLETFLFPVIPRYGISPCYGRLKRFLNVSMVLQLK